MAFIALIASVHLAGCTGSEPASTLSRKLTSGGEIRYTLHTPDQTVRHRVILAHGFLRSPRTMRHLAEAFAKEGIQTACIGFRHSTPWAGNHEANARDMIALRSSLGWDKVVYAGFSAGGLSALLAAAEDSGCEKLLLLDPVDHGGLGTAAAPKVRVPTLAILGKPGPGNAWRNASSMLAAIPSVRIIEIPVANHCDFEANPSFLCHLLTASAPDPARGNAVHENLNRACIPYLDSHAD